MILFSGEYLSVLDSIFATDIAQNNLDKEKMKITSYTINLKEMGIINVKDLVFLHGYYDPTLLILYEPRRTWASRLAILKDTSTITCISFNFSQKLHPIIWSSDKLPFDCRSLHPLHDSIGGGALVFAANSILYFNQNNKYGISMNKFSTPIEGEPTPIPLGIL